jgi:hypothetical protein
MVDAENAPGVSISHPIPRHVSLALLERQEARMAVITLTARVQDSTALTGNMPRRVDAKSAQKASIMMLSGPRVRLAQMDKYEAKTAATTLTAKMLKTYATTSSLR